MPQAAEYAIAVIGGATAGAEAAGIFASQGIRTVVFEQNARPYGKVEDGLPRWHVALRQKEYRSIDAKLDQAGVDFVPQTRIDRDPSLEALAGEWGFHAVVLANGAWRDRGLPIEGADSFVGRGLVYQNAFVYWFNHYDEASFPGEQFEIVDDALVVGGGLASIDVAKAINLELALRALGERGIEADLVETEVAGIPNTLAKHGLRWEDLGLRGARIIYRRRPEDMPLIELPENADDKVRTRVAKSRARVLEKAMDKYLFRLEPLLSPHGLLVDGDRLVGLTFARTRMEDGRLVVTDETLDVHAPLVISSIGSIPEPMDALPMKGELYAFDDWDLGRIGAFPTLFSVGNVVTGKGNIVASRKHARHVSQHMLEAYFALGEAVRKLPPLDTEQASALERRVRAQQAQTGYDGDYRAWIAAHTPSDRV